MSAFESLPPTRLPLQPLPFVTRGMRWGSIGAVVAATLFSGQSSDSELIVRAWAAAALFVAALFLGRSLRRVVDLPALELHEDWMVLPRGEHSEQSVSVPYEALRGALSRRHAEGESLVIHADGKSFTYPQAMFEDRDALQVFFMQLRARLARHPRGRQIVAEIRHRELQTQRILAVRPRATQTLIVILVVVGLIEVAIGAVGVLSVDPLMLGILGSNMPERVADGEWYRLLSANFLHSGALHLYLNGIALLSLGSVLEKLMGRSAFLLLYLVSGVGGAAASALYAVGPQSLGASTSVFGLLGALAVYHVFFRSEIPFGYRQSAQWWAFVLGINILLPVLVPVIDVMAHAGGFAIGAGLSFLLLRFATARQSRRPDSRVRALCAVVVLIHIVALGAAVRAAVFLPESTRVEITTALYDPQIRRTVDEFSSTTETSLARFFATVLERSVRERGAAWLGVEPVAVGAKLESANALELASEGFRPRQGASLWFLGTLEDVPTVLLLVPVAPGERLPTRVTFDTKVAPETRIELAAVVSGEAPIDEATAWLVAEAGR